MSILNPVLIFLGLSLYITNAASEENRPYPTITRITDGIFTEREYFEFISCETYGEADYFLFSCAYRALVYVLPHDAFYKINFGSSRARCYSPQMRAKYYQGNNTMLVAFQCGAWIVFCTLETSTTTTKVVQFDLANEKEIIDFLIWKDVVFVKGPQGSYFLTELKDIFEPSSTNPLVIQGRLCDMVDSVRSNSLTKKKLVTTRNKVIFFSHDERAIIVNTLSNDALNITTAIYLMKPTDLDPICNEHMDITSYSDGNLFSIICPNGIISYIYNVDPLNLVKVVENREILFEKGSAMSGFWRAVTLRKEINLSSEIFFAGGPLVENNTKFKLTWKRFYRFLEPSHVLSQQEISMTVDLSHDCVIAALQDRSNHEFVISTIQWVNSTHTQFIQKRYSLPAELSGDQNFIELGDKYCLSNNHSFCLPTNCSLIDYHHREPSPYFRIYAKQIYIDNCIENYWKIACGTPAQDWGSHNSTYSGVLPKTEQICLETASKTRQRSENCLHAEFNKSCQLYPFSIVFAPHDSKCQPKMTDLSFSSSIKVIKIDSVGLLPKHCRFSINTEGGQYHILITIDEFKYQLTDDGIPGFLSIKAYPHVEGEIMIMRQAYPGKTENTFTFLGPRDYLEIEYSHISVFQFRVIKIPYSKAILHQFECLACVSPWKDCSLTADGKRVHLQSGEFRAWMPDKGCFWMNSKSPEDINLLPQARTSFSMCPKIADTNFCSMNQTNQDGEIFLNADDYIFPLCRQVFTFENTRNIEIRMQIQSYEALYVVVNQKIISSIMNLTDDNLTIIVHSNDLTMDIEVFLFTLDPASTIRLSSNQPKIFLRVIDLISPLTERSIFNLLVFLLKLLIPFVVILNLCGYHIRRRLRTLRGRHQLELKNVQNPYAKIEFENRHELSIQLSQKEIMELEALGINIDRSGNKVDKGDAECAVCLEKVEVRPHQLYLCGRHYVHIDCFKEWLDKSLEQGSMDLCPMRCGTIALEPEPTVPSVSESQERETETSLIHINQTM